jgi:RimJ/RimL family protein N-acetyltransferase
VKRSFAFTTKDGHPGVVRVAHPRDAREANRIVAETLRERPRTLTVTPAELWNARTWRRFRLDWGPSGVWLVAEVDGRVAGQLDVRRSPRAGERHRVEFGITVAADYRGRGVGRALMEALEVWAREHGVTKIMLHVFATNERAQKLYESMGYEVEGRLRRHVRFSDGEEIDNLVMAKFLQR